MKLSIKVKSYFFLLLFLIIIPFKAEALELLRNGKSNYEIYINSNANAVKREAALEFQRCFFEISSVKLQITNVFNGRNQIVIGDDSLIKNYFPKFNRESLGLDGTFLKSKDDLLFLSGGTELGVRYSVYSFFESYLGCRYYAHDLIVMPKKLNIKITKINLIEVPPFIYRSTNYGEALNKDYLAWHKVSNIPNAHRQKRYKWGLWAHTFTLLVPPEKYLKTHPELFGLVRGVRSSKQLCLSQDALVDIVVGSLKEMMVKDPTSQYWSVSAMDGNPEICQCEKCNAYRSQGRNQSDLTVEFVNKVAAQFPDKIISTLAYQKTRTPPTYVIPASNVNIHFCAVNDNKLEYISTNHELMEDLRGWQKKTKNVIFRDYMIYFKCDCPFPNFNVITQNLRDLASQKISMLYLEAHSGLGKELEELRCYLMVKAMWNPNLNANLVIDEFLKAYYNIGAPYIREYIDTLYQLAIKANKPLNNSVRLKEYSKSNSDGYLVDRNIAIYRSILSRALEATKDDENANTRIKRIVKSLENVSSIAN